MIKLYSSVIAASLILSSSAQDCSTGRYTSPVFQNVSVQSAIPFGSNTGVAGGTQTLRMDVYQPTGDVQTSRPVIIVAFGGSFIGGSRADVANLCMLFARMGYVAIAPDYRVGFFFPNQATTTRAVMRGSHDVKACVRYLRRSVVELGNPYGIDPDRIISGGVSAGAISALHATYLDQTSEIPAVLVPEMPALGGVEGNSGSPGYSSAVLACLSFSGAIGDTAWINAGDAPCVSVHEVGDGVVPYYTQQVSVVGIPTGLIASGSHDIHVRFNNLAIPNCFLSYPGSGHVGYLSSDLANAMNYVALFCGEESCGLPISCGELSTSIADRSSDNHLVAYPDPTTGPLQFEVDGPVSIAILDLSGRQVGQYRSGAGVVRMDLSHLPDGVYVLRVSGAVEQWTRFVKAGN